METKPNKAFSSIKQGLEEALKFSEGKAGKVNIHKLLTADTQQQLEESFFHKKNNKENSNDLPE
ncbi:hypothetical protein [Cellvibrio sp. QJXJ]|uniref:hypothetical protein n=1 Tax=Cellvibrio sp. QJXJ TaxID=2964606 RepID=UPI0021C280BE|nr:hypothetical protein [Cellvibrio sp. QJXJ]UUA70894.1 hypothetical protein NNX04_10705 [Cellvibrio sp. QJXJ]